MWFTAVEIDAHTWRRMLESRLDQEQLGQVLCDNASAPVPNTAVNKGICDYASRPLSGHMDALVYRCAVCMHTELAL